MKTARLRIVQYYPSGGWPGRQWAEDPRSDALAKSARRVSERYSELIADHDIRARAAVYQIFPHLASAESSDVELVVFTDWLGTSEGARVDLPASVDALDGYGRALLALEITHQACLALGGVLGWPTEPFEQARATLLAEGLAPVWHGPWKSSPDRRLRARVAQRINDDGVADVWVELADRDGPLGRGPFAPGEGDLAAFGRAIKALRWKGSSTVERAGHSVAIGNLFTDLPTEGVLDETPVDLPAITTHVHSDNDPANPSAVTIGEIHFLPPPRSFKTAWQEFRAAEEPLLAWWSTSGLAALLIQVAIGSTDDVGSSSTHRAGRDLEVWVTVDPATLTESNGAQAATKALQEGVRLAARRAKIPFPSDLS